jgi:argininosuccinate lyase
MKLWKKSNYSLHPLVEKFTVGNDRKLDLAIAYYDAQASIAHAEMLCKQNYLTENECLILCNALREFSALTKNENFIIEVNFEDIHSKLEHYLIMKCGDAGKKIHTGRSRNDQVLTAIKLYYVATIDSLHKKIEELIHCCSSLEEKFSGLEMPGYTHMQVAMPSSFSMWIGAYKESLTEDAELLLSIRKFINRNPLGSGAGYGVPFLIDRNFTTEKLEFEKANENPIYAQMTRGKCDRQLLFGLSNLAATFNKLCSDLVLYMGQDFQFFSFPENFTTGSSIMPHKKNPDVFELVRASCNRIHSGYNEINLLSTNMPSGYHRDWQLLKNIVFPAIESMNEMTDVLLLTLPEMQVNKNVMQQDKYKHIQSVKRIEELVKGGMSFRDAYQKVGESL